MTPATPAGISLGMQPMLPVVRTMIAAKRVSALPRPVFMPFRVSDSVYKDSLLLWLRGATYGEIAKLLALSKEIVTRCAESPEWVDAAERMRPQLQLEEEQVTSRLAALARKKLEERLHKGDEHVTKDGAIVRKAVSARDCVAVMEVAAERRDKTRRAIEGVPEPNSTTALEDLFRVASALVAANDVARKDADAKRDAIDATPTEAIEVQPIPDNLLTANIPSFTKPIPQRTRPVELGQPAELIVED